MKSDFFKNLKKNHPDLSKLIRSSSMQDWNWEWDILCTALIEKGEHSSAIKLGKEYFKNNKPNSAAYSFLAKMYVRANKVSLAIETYKHGIRNIDSISVLYKEYAKLSEDYFGETKAIEIYQEALERKPHLVTHRNYVKFLINCQRYDYAETQVTLAISRHPSKSAHLYLLLSKIHEKKGDFEEAEEVLRDLINRNNNNGAAWKNLSKLLLRKDNYNNELNITRVIEFEPEYHSSGIAILQNFGKLLRDKYSESPVKVTISQEDLRVKMVITPPDGKRVEVEEYLYKYGLVVKGEITPEELVQEPIQVMELKSELMMARTRIEIQREQMLFLNDNNSSKIESLENQVGWLREQVGNGLVIQNDNFNTLAEVFKDSNENSQKLSSNLIKALRKENKEKVKKTVMELKTQNPEDYSRLKDFINNVGANAPSWIEFLSSVLPK